jgi:hypothetical protein
MIIEEGMFTCLNGLELVATGSVYPRGGIPQKAARPYLTYYKVSGPRDSTHSGNSKLARSRFQIEVWSECYLQAKRIASELIEDLNGYRGPMGDVARVACEVDNELDQFDSETRLHHIVVDVILWNSEE